MRQLIKPVEYRSKKVRSSAVPFADCTFDVVTAVETHYYWPDLPANVREVFRVLKPGGSFVLIAETYRGGPFRLIYGAVMPLLRAAYLTDEEHRDLLEGPASSKSTPNTCPERIGFAPFGAVRRSCAVRGCCTQRRPPPLGTPRPYQLPLSLMLDLAFVRNNLPLVEEKLRQRGMDPAVVLKDFHAIDTQRRTAITEAETTKARRNKLTEEFQQLRKAQQDTAANLAGAEGTEGQERDCREAGRTTTTRSCATS